MRSLINRKDDSKRNQLILGIFLIIIMLFSTLGYALGGKNKEDSNKKVEYNGIEFIQDNSGYWNFNIQGTDFMTKYNPEELEDIDFFTDLNINAYSNNPLYLVSEFDEPNYELGRNLKNFILRMQKACLSKEDCLNGLPVKNCSVDNIIVIQEPLAETDSETIYQQENCVYILANLENQTRYADKFLFRILRIE